MRDGYYFSGKCGFTLRTLGPKPPDGADVWWRADDRRYANFDQWADEQPTGSHLVIEMTPFVADRYTAKGVWVRNCFGGETFILGAAIKQMAVPTRELALADLIARKEKHVRMCEARLNRATEHLSAAKLVLEKSSLRAPIPQGFEA